MIIINTMYFTYITNGRIMQVQGGKTMENLTKLKKALEFARERHKNQKRKGSGLPYFVHIKGVVEILFENGASIDTMVAGALHDTIEDTGTTIDEIVEKFGVKVAYLVDSVTEKKSLQYMDRKMLQIERIKNSSKEVKMIKCADCLSNLSDTLDDLRDIGESMWDKFNSSKSNIQKHYYETILAMSDLDGLEMYTKLQAVYRDVFTEQSKASVHADSKTKKYCTDCSQLKRILTPDPNDWFCDDDQTYVCGISGKTLSEANRPYEKQIAPSDCPLERE